MSKPTLNYTLIQGEGKDIVVFLHGLGANMNTFSAAPEYEFGDKNILLLDHVGHGKSDTPETGFTMLEMATEVHRLLEEIAPDGKISLVLHSMGGAIGIFLAEMLKDRVDRVVFAEGNIDFDDCFFSNWIITRHSLEEWVEKGFKRMLDRFEKDPNNQDYAVMFSEAGPVTTYMASVDLVKVSKDDVLLDKLVELNVPVLAVFGDQNKGKYLSEGRLAEHFPVEYIEDAGHNMMIDNPDQFYEAVRSFLE